MSDRSCPKGHGEMEMVTKRFGHNSALKQNGSPGWEAGGLAVGAFITWRCHKCGYETKEELETY